MKKENRLLTIDGETLMSQPLTPLNFVVDTNQPADFVAKVETEVA